MRRSSSSSNPFHHRPLRQQRRRRPLRRRFRSSWCRFVAVVVHLSARRRCLRPSRGRRPRGTCSSRIRPPRRSAHLCRPSSSSRSEQLVRPPAGRHCGRLRSARRGSSAAPPSSRRRSAASAGRPSQISSPRRLAVPSPSSPAPLRPRTARPVAAVVRRPLVVRASARCGTCPRAARRRPGSRAAPPPVAGRFLISASRRLQLLVAAHPHLCPSQLLPTAVRMPLETICLGHIWACIYTLGCSYPLSSFACCYCCCLLLVPLLVSVESMQVCC